MTSLGLGLGLLSGWIVMHLFGTDRRWPWRVVDLSPDADGSDRIESLRVIPPAVDGAELTPTPGRSPGRMPAARRASTDRAGRPRSRAERRRRRQVETDLPVAVDLLHLAVSAGHSLHTAVRAVGDTGSGPVSGALAEAHHRYSRGSRLVDELAALPDQLGPSARPLSTTLVVATSSGTPLGPTLQRLADAERRRLRRRTEERVRRLPVLLLAPLIGLVLPAFILLTVVPVAITTARTGLTTVSSTSAPDSFTSSPETSSSPRSTP